MRITVRKRKIDQGWNCLSGASKATELRMVKFQRFIIILAAAFALHNANAAEVNVFAAASLTDAMKEIAANYEKQSGDKIVFNFGASSLLARQIIERSPGDIFFLAGEAKLDVSI